MRRWIVRGMVVFLGLGWGVTPSRGQVRERDVTVTGPRGRSIERDIKTERGPGFVDRQVNITRPGGTFHSNSMIARPGPVAGRPPAWGGGWGGPRPFVVERDVFVNNGPGPWLPLAIGGGLFGLGALAGAAFSSPPPPPVVVNPVVPVVVAPPPQAQVVFNPPQPYNAGGQPPTVVIDPVADAMGRLRSHHDHSRRDGAYTLGRLRDPRAVPVLIERLKYDGAKEVRVASAVALGEIGDPRAAIFLERATIYDKKQDVRDAAATALSRMPREVPVRGQVVNPSSTPGAHPQGAVVPNLSAPTSLEPIERVPPPPIPATPSAFRNAP